MSPYFLPLSYRFNPSSHQTAWWAFNSSKPAHPVAIRTVRTQVEGFAFNDFCLQCQKVTEHKIVSENQQLYGICSSCNESRQLTEVKQVHYAKADLWVTRFKIGNLPSVVTGKLLDAIRHI